MCDNIAAANNNNNTNNISNNNNNNNVINSIFWLMKPEGFKCRVQNTSSTVTMPKQLYQRHHIDMYSFDIHMNVNVISALMSLNSGIT